MSLLGRFEETPSGDITFSYDDASSVETPLSLSLMPGREHHPNAAAAFLDNLLPDNKKVRARWASERATGGSDPMSLLAHYGEDVAGALSLSPNEHLVEREPDVLAEATEDDIAARIAALRNDDTSWTDPRARPRMSLGGQQGKFSLARVGNRWFWPTYEVPSTHIFKPPRRDLHQIEEFEHGALRMAQTIGLATTHSDVMDFRGQRAFAVERWDRFEGVRLHAEDLAQSLGRAVGEKYDITAADVVSALRGHGADIDPFLRQFAYNVYLGNADGHGKNYSVLLAGSQVQLAPLYDTVPTFLYDQYDTNLAMSVGRSRNALHANRRNWFRFAQESGLDPEYVDNVAFSVRDELIDKFETYIRPVATDTHRQHLLHAHLRLLERNAKENPRPASAVAPARHVASGPSRTRRMNLGLPGNGGEFASRARPEAQGVHLTDEDRGSDSD